MHYHIVGIAGAGMSALAAVLLEQGHTVSGSDLTANQLTAALAARGATIYAGHSPTYVVGADALLATAAVPADHPELAAARQAGIPLLKRGDLWRDWTRERTIIAVAGTHGKTTTTALIAWLLERSGHQPGFLVGGESPDLGTNARWGSPAAPLVIEADEYDRAFLALIPHVTVVTSIEWDHPDIYPTVEAYEEVFAQFADETEGVMILCGDQGGSRRLLDLLQPVVPVITYGLADGSDYQAVGVAGSPLQPGAPFRIRRPNQQSGIVHTREETVAAPTEYQTALPGLHNIQNALAALVVGALFGLDEDGMAAALREFRGTARRFEVRGEAGGVTVIDDYAHHPSEVRATLNAARARFGPRRIVAYVQPHTFSRTHALRTLWPGAFGAADLVLVGAIYAARETDAAGKYAGLAPGLATAVAGTGRAAHYVGEVAAAAANVPDLLRPGDVLITMGAGDGYRVGEAALVALRGGADVAPPAGEG